MKTWIGYLDNRLLESQEGKSNMGVFVNPDNEAFRVAINSEIYIDKTGLLKYTNKVINTLQGYICNSRPRRFGKSVTANMLAAYYSRGCDSKEMFSGYDIAKSSEFMSNLNKYDVIHFDAQWCLEPAGGSKNLVSYITNSILDELRVYYSECITQTITSLPAALAKINSLTGRKFVIIIDEWDILIRDESENKKVQQEYIEFLSGLFKGVEPTKYIALAYITGILPIKKMKTQSALNNFDEYTMLDADELAPYIGFTENDVKALCEKYDRDYEKVKRWYDGYVLEDYQIYNPRAVVNVMLKGKYKSYWSETGSYEVILPLINKNFDGLKTSIIEMLSGNSVRVNTRLFQNDAVSFTNKDDVLTYLIHLGYLGFDQKTQSAFVPNEELRLELSDAVESTKWNEFLEFQQESEELLNLTLDMDSDAVAEKIEKIHEDYVSAIQYNNENSLSSVITIAYLSAMLYYFKPVREYPTGKGFADFVFIPKTEYSQDYPALIVELKWDKSKEAALAQIKHKNYPNAVNEYTGKILLVGINYDKKTKEHQCVIEEYRK